MMRAEFLFIAVRSPAHTAAGHLFLVIKPFEAHVCLGGEPNDDAPALIVFVIRLPPT